MRFWFSRSGDVSLKEQLVTQVVLAIASGDLRPGEKLPSTRQLARLAKVHANTVSAAYQELESRGWLTSRNGSGVYVLSPADRDRQTSDLVERSIADLVRVARAAGLTAADLRARVLEQIDAEREDHFLILEDEAPLRDMLAFEIGQALQVPVRGCATADCADAAALAHAIPLVLATRRDRAERVLPAGKQAIALQLRSVQQSFAAYLAADRNAMIAIVSAWSGFLDRARTVLIAAGFNEDAILLRDPSQHNWKRGLSTAAAVLCDLRSQPLLPRHPRIIAFPLLSDASMEELRSIARTLHPTGPTASAVSGK